MLLWWEVSLNLLLEHSQEVSEFMCRDHQLSCKGALVDSLEWSAQPCVPHGQSSIPVGTLELMGKDVRLHDQDARDVPPGVNSSSPQPPRESGGLWSGTFMDIFDAVKYIISGNTRMEPSSPVRTIAHWLPVGKTVLKFITPLQLNGQKHSSGNQTFKLVNKTNWVLCWKQGIQKWWPNFWDSVACLKQERGKQEMIC